MAADDIKRLVKQRAYSMTVENLGRGASFGPPSLHLETEWGVVFRVSAPNAGDAEEAVRRERLPQLLAVLDTIGDYPYRVELLAVTDESTMTDVSHYEFGSFALLRVDAMDKAVMPKLYGRWRLIREDPAAHKIADRLRSGTALADLVGLVESRVGEAAIEDLYLALEALGRANVRRVREQDQERIESERNQVADELAQALPATPSADRPGLIAAAKMELDRINMEWVSLQVEAAGAQLGLDAEMIAEAVALCKVRNKVAHGGAEWATILDWLGGPQHRAFRVASAYVAAFLDQRAAADTE